MAHPGRAACRLGEAGGRSAAALVDGAAAAEQRHHAGPAMALASPPSLPAPVLATEPAYGLGACWHGEAGGRSAAAPVEGSGATPYLPQRTVAAAPWLLFLALALHKEDKAEDQCLACHLRGRCLKFIVGVNAALSLVGAALDAHAAPILVSFLLDPSTICEYSEKSVASKLRQEVKPQNWCSTLLLELQADAGSDNCLQAGPPSHHWLCVLVHQSSSCIWVMKYLSQTAAHVMFSLDAKEWGKTL
ncbi:hypothetical protein U9M48_028755 [Paspalum notatum var. saurae]|uniref:Uncharacterized protein n=1 Tax=Paspalum notatum var. saurae TaxID=547442 RepID=A0AAQ3TZ86_PASNO